jgi:hypothetical protein
MMDKPHLISDKDENERIFYNFNLLNMYIKYTLSREVLYLM